MKKWLLPVAARCLLLLFVFGSGCIKDTVKRTYTYTMYQPVYQTKPTVRTSIKSYPAQAIEQAGKLVIYGSYIFLNEVDKGIHVIDNSDPVQPKNIAFISIPGNVDLAIKGNTLYADLYTNLIALDISNPAAVRLKKTIPDVFASRVYYGGNVVINGIDVQVDSSIAVTNYIVKDTTVTEAYTAAAWENINNRGVILFDSGCPTCAFALNGAPVPAASGPKVGISGSLARFTIIGDRLYTVGNHEALKVFNISEAASPQFVSDTYIGLAIETIFPFHDKLFIGAANGMYIYDISNPDQPKQVSLFTHVETCDPVIADGNYAYVTLRSGTVCNGTINELEVLDISSLQQPSLLKTYSLTHPLGLSKDGDLLFVCDDDAGLKIYDASKPSDLHLRKTISGLTTYDVIATNGRAIVVAKDGLYQFDYTDAANIRQLSRISL